MALNRRDALGVAGGILAGTYSLGELNKELGDEVVVNSDYNRMEDEGQVFLTTYTSIDSEKLALEYQKPGNEEWKTAKVIEPEESGEQAFTYGFGQVEELGDYTFRGIAYDRNNSRHTSDQEIVKFVDEIESQL